MRTTLSLAPPTATCRVGDCPDRNGPPHPFRDECWVNSTETRIVWIEENRP